jgi:hypothetical protein
MSDRTRREFINRTMAAGGTLAVAQFVGAIGVAHAAPDTGIAGQAAALLPPNDPGAAQAAWRELIDFLRTADMTFLDGRRGQFDQYETAYGYRSLIHMLMNAVNMHMEDDPNWPEFVQLDTRNAPFLGGNPDTRYLYAPIQGGRRYRIRGHRGDEAYMSFTSHRGDRGSGFRQRFDDNINHHTIKTDADGRFEVILSAEREGENWLHISPDAAVVLARTYVLDRDRDRPATFTIESMDPQPPPPRLRPDEVAQRLRLTMGLVREQASFAVPRPPAAPGELNTVTRQGYRFKIGQESADWATPDNTYTEGRFFLDPSQALLLEGTVVPCDYWGIQIWNPFLASPDYRYHKVSINKAEAKLGPNGQFRVAIAHNDPKVPGLDWLSTAGERQGTFYIRWLMAQAEAPKVTAKLVKIADLGR